MRQPLAPSRLPALLLLLAAVLILDGARSPARAVTNPTYSYFPTPATNDGRMLFISGLPLQTMAGATIEMRIAVPDGSTAFEVGIFDGDTGKNTAGQLVDPGGSWDAGTAQLEYTLYADPQGNSTGSVVIGRWFGNSPNPTSGSLWTASSATMPDNQWWSANVGVSTAARSAAGHYFYRLVVRLLDLQASVISAFKLRTSGTVSLVPGSIGIMGVLNQYTDAYNIYPTWAGDYPPADPFFFANAPTTYDGSWRFFLDLGTSATELRLWDGDLDLGNSAAVTEPSQLTLTPSADTDDPDSPDTLPTFATLGHEQREAAQGTGLPEDDSFFDLLRRSPAVEYTLTDPRGQAYRIPNPSGNLEWEQFRITTDSTALRQLADYSPVAAEDDSSFVTEPRLAPGLWRLDLTGIDLGNGCFLRFDRSIIGVTEDGGPAEPLRPLLLGDRVWRDTSGNGVQDGNEVGMAGIVIDLLDAAGVYLESTVTDATGNYAFDVVPGTYTVRVSYANFGPGRPLLGLHSTTGGQKRTATLTNASNLTLDFGYGVGGSQQGAILVSGTVWYDLDGNALQESDEPGFNQAGVTLSGANGLMASALTDDTGSYEFPGLTAGTYTLTVDTSTLPTGLRPTYDFDGLSTTHAATLTVSATSTQAGVAFGYTDASPGTGPYTTYEAGAWGTSPSGNNPGQKLATHFATVYPGGAVTVGGNYTLAFTSASAIERFLPQGGKPAVLTTSYTNPTARLSNFAGNVLGLRLNVDFSAAGVFRTGLGALTVQSGPLAGYTVAQVLALCNTVLGGSTGALPAGMTVENLNDAAASINRCFNDGRTNTGFVQ